MLTIYFGVGIFAAVCGASYLGYFWGLAAGRGDMQIRMADWLERAENEGRVCNGR